ncbi:HAD family hydrolase [Myxococcota bacterium]|nr:HAD family hydrolase [Myxococcota bacterium]
MDLDRRTHWIFDMDGTLTVPLHDFAWLRAQLHIRPDQDILTALGERPADRAAADRAFIDAWEDGLARRAQAQQDALALLAHLGRRGCTMGILTRNSQAGTHTTLEAAGLARWFSPRDRVGRDDAAPKPDPAGVHRLLDGWGVGPEVAVVVGDWIHDVRAGKRAGTATVLVRRHGPQPWEGEADRVVEDLRELVGAGGTRAPALDPGPASCGGAERGDAAGRRH